ncbi:hypothetical protein Tsp_04692 [Trichinella spiralis]|uniref:hypothetical protein n=1 Tax=Trichinella spiralis TaxID=6334 RepID=UPI0001EFD7CB|nr:hypothetical protein Tsp_04692 [Trichinella spiralis]
MQLEFCWKNRTLDCYNDFEQIACLHSDDPLNVHDAFLKKNSKRNCVNWGRYTIYLHSTLVPFFLTENFFKTGNHFNYTPPCFKSPLVICELIHDFYNLGDAVVESRNSCAVLTSELAISPLIAVITSTFSSWRNGQNSPKIYEIYHNARSRNELA